MMRRGRASSDERFREAHVGMVGEGRRRALEEMSRLTVKRSADDLRVLYDELKARRERVALDFDRRQR
jgi:hypothetical protein